MRVSVDNPEVNLLAGPDLCVGNASGAAGRSSKTPLNMMRAGADMLSSVARVQVSPHLATWGWSCCPFFGGRGRHPRATPMSRMTTGPTTTASPSGAAGSTTSSVNRVQTQRRRHRQPPCDVEGPGVLESILGETLDARQPHVVANPPDVVEVQTSWPYRWTWRHRGAKAARVSPGGISISTKAPFSLTPATGGRLETCITWLAVGTTPHHLER